MSFKQAIQIERMIVMGMEHRGIEMEVDKGLVELFESTLGKFEEVEVGQKEGYVHYEIKSENKGELQDIINKFKGAVTKLLEDNAGKNVLVRAFPNYRTDGTDHWIRCRLLIEE